MQTLTVNAADKRYRYFQFFGFSDGDITGEIRLNGALLHSLQGEPNSIATNAAQTAVKLGENILELVLQSGSGELDYALLAASGPDDDMDPDRIVELQQTVAVAPGQDCQLHYRFVLDGPAFALLKP